MHFLLISFFCVNRATRLAVEPIWRQAQRGVKHHSRSQPWLHCHWSSSTSTEGPQGEKHNLLLRCLALMLSLPLLECCAGKIKFVYLILLGIVAKTVNINILFCTSRLYLAATHSNENADRPQAETEEGVPLKISFPKARKGECRTKPQDTGDPW